jgi:glutamine transport system substrate-binding protein
MAMKLDNKNLADKINAGLKKVKDSGKYNEIYKKYFNVDAPQF